MDLAQGSQRRLVHVRSSISVGRPAGRTFWRQLVPFIPTTHVQPYVDEVVDAWPQSELRHLFCQLGHHFRQLCAVQIVGWNGAYTAWNQTEPSRDIVSSSFP
jgi:hypothetical protein